MARKPAAAPARPALTITERQIADLKPYAKNSRTHTPEQIAAVARSISEFGWTVPVLIDEKGGIIAGHGRIEAAKSLGMTMAPTITAHGWTKDQIKAYVIADNRLTDRSGWDDTILRDELNDLLASGFDIALTGFDGDALKAVIDGWAPDPVLQGLTPELTAFTETIRIVVAADKRAEVEAAVATLIADKGWTDVSIR
jgi:ParB-like chromosome segregation protein Spo0J